MKTILLYSNCLISTNIIVSILIQLIRTQFIISVELCAMVVKRLTLQHYNTIDCYKNFKRM